jgi:Tfp pilus assembly protein PilX
MTQLDREMTHVRARRRREGGAALLVSMLLMVAMTLIGFASLDTVMRDRETAGFNSLSQTALYGADAGLAASLDVLRTEILANAVAAGDCLTAPVPSATLPNGTTYGPDSTAAVPGICMVAAAEPCDEIDGSAEWGATPFRYTVWSIRTEGVAPAGATSRIQATAERCHAFN